jgi:hypothetical protein
MPLSRRAFLAGFGGGVASTAVVWGAWRYAGWAAVAEGDPVPACCDYVDYGGWMVTRADKERLLDAGTVRRMENTVFEGNDIASQLVPGLDECESWCLGDPDCQGFTFAKPTHPDPNVQNRCWLKGTSDLTPVANPGYTSGVR